jgi:SAM-dependent methyltransferase
MSSKYNELLEKSIFKDIRFMVGKPESKTDPPPEKLVKLNIGCGPNMFPFDGWTNYDHVDFNFFIDWVKSNPTDSMPHIQHLANYVRAGGDLSTTKHNLNDGFPQHPDNSVDIIYVGQVIEHLNPIFQAPKLITECYRMLKSGGVLRMTTPDLDLLISAYINGEMEKFAIEQPAFYRDHDPSGQLAMLMFGACGENCTFDNYEGHMFLYTEKSMNKLLKHAGFEKIFYYDKTGKSVSEVMKKEAVDQGMTHSLCVEAVK